MAASVEQLANCLKQVLGGWISETRIQQGELTVIVEATDLLRVMQALRDHEALRFDQLIDITGVDYAAYGQGEWITEQASTTGFSRGVDGFTPGRLGLTGIYGVHEIESTSGQRFAAVYHLLSVALNQRVRVRVFCEDDNFPLLDSMVGIWTSADWFEREAFDLYGIIFNGHPDLRRILTDYGFVGHPFRKDFPLIGNVEVRYDEERQRVVYEPVSIEPRVLVPRVVRQDNRYSERAPTEDRGDA